MVNIIIARFSASYNKPYYSSYSRYLYEWCLAADDADQLLAGRLVPLFVPGPDPLGGGAVRLHPAGAGGAAGAAATNAAPRLVADIRNQSLQGEVSTGK